MAAVLTAASLPEAGDSEFPGAAGHLVPRGEAATHGLLGGHVGGRCCCPTGWAAYDPLRVQRLVDAGTARGGGPARGGQPRDGVTGTAPGGRPREVTGTAGGDGPGRGCWYCLGDSPGGGCRYCWGGGTARRGHWYGPGGARPRLSLQAVAKENARGPPGRFGRLLFGSSRSFRELTLSSSSYVL